MLLNYTITSETNILYNIKKIVTCLFVFNALLIEYTKNFFEHKLFSVFPRKHIFFPLSVCIWSLANVSPTSRLSKSICCEPSSSMHANTDWLSRLPILHLDTIPNDINLQILPLFLMFEIIGFSVYLDRLFSQVFLLTKLPQFPPHSNLYSFD